MKTDKTDKIENVAAHSRWLVDIGGNIWVMLIILLCTFIPGILGNVAAFIGLAYILYHCTFTRKDCIREQVMLIEERLKVMKDDIEKEMTETTAPEYKLKTKLKTVIELVGAAAKNLEEIIA